MHALRFERRRGARAVVMEGAAKPNNMKHNLPTATGARVAPTVGAGVTAVESAVVAVSEGEGGEGFRGSSSAVGNDTARKKPPEGTAVASLGIARAGVRWLRWKGAAT